MKAVTRETSQPQQLNTNPTKTTTTTTTKVVEDEALKRNTDCVYYLASPLTCKKGDDCEYRHSEEARMNPRDCWYWLNGNCLNPKCSFRHPPLDGLVGNTVATSAKPSFPPSLPATSTQFPAVGTFAYNPVKQGTPCYYFQKGQCLKGDRCAFMHGSQSIDHVAPQPPAPKIATPVTEPQTLKKPHWVLDKCNQQKNFPQENVIKPVAVPPPAKPPVKAVAAPLENGIGAGRSMQPIALDNELSRYKAANAPSIISGNPASRTHRGRPAQTVDDRNFRNVKEPDEFLGETSPGFDVLVEDELLETDYYEKEHDFGRMAGHGGRHLNSVNEIDYGHSGDYNPIAKLDRETYSESHGYDSYGRPQDRYAREQRKASSERTLDRSSVPERRGLPRVESSDQMDELDLRYRLSKQRRINGSRSAVSPDSRGDFYRRDDRGRHAEEQRYQSQTRRDSRYLSHESSRSNRLQGRISLPGRSSPDRSRNDSHSEVEMDRERKWARLSPVRRPILPYPGRAQDRIKRVEDEFNTEGRSFRAPFIRRDEEDTTLDFAPPKRLVELKKGAKLTERGEEEQTRNRKFGSHQEVEGSSSFQSPKPLREILKRKRQEKSSVSEDDIAFGRGEGDDRKEMEGNSLSLAETTNEYLSSKEEHRFTSTTANGTVDDDDDDEEEEGLISEEAEGHPSAQKGSEQETEDMIILDNGEDEEFETSDQRDAESDYEQVDGDFKAEEDDNPDPEEEYFDDEDGDDFAKRIGVLFS